MLGVKSERAIRRFPDGSRARAALERRYREPTLWDAFLRYLVARGLRRSGTRISTATSIARVEPSPEIQRILVERLPRATRRTPELCERLVDLDEGRPGVALPPRQDGRSGRSAPNANWRIVGRAYLRETIGRRSFRGFYGVIRN